MRFFVHCCGLIHQITDKRLVKNEKERIENCNIFDGFRKIRKIYIFSNFELRKIIEKCCIFQPVTKITLNGFCVSY